jgi:hypothetical protein
MNSASDDVPDCARPQEFQLKCVVFGKLVYTATTYTTYIEFFLASTLRIELRMPSHCMKHTY